MSVPNDALYNIFSVLIRHWNASLR